MSSWAVSACYPRRTFYPLSDGPSTQNHRITMTDFRLCSTCQSHSQAGYAIALYERFLTVLSLPSHASVTIWEATAPSNYPPYNVLMPDSGNQLDTKKNKRYFTDDSTKADAFASMSPSYAKYVFPNTNVKLQ